MHILKLQCKEKTICTVIHETAQSVIGIQQTQSSLCDGMKSLVYFITTIVISSLLSKAELHQPQKQSSNYSLS